MSHDNRFNATAGMLGNAVAVNNSMFPMKEPEELVTPEQEALTLKLRLMAEQVENERLRKAERKARHAMRKRKYYHHGRKQHNRFSFSLSKETAEELAAWMEAARRSTVKQAPKGVIKFSNVLSKRIAERNKP